MRTVCHHEGQLVLESLKTEDIFLVLTTVLLRSGLGFRVRIRIQLVLEFGKCTVQTMDYRQTVFTSIVIQS